MYYKRAERWYLYCNMLQEWLVEWQKWQEWQKGPFSPPHTSTAGYIMFYIIQGTLCKEMDLLACYLHKSALYFWGPLFIAVVPLQAAVAPQEWTPTQREFGWGRMVSVRGQLINTHECWFVPGGLVCMKRAEDAPSLEWGTAWPVCYYWGLLESSWQREREKQRQCSDSRITISLATHVIALETVCQQAWNTTMLQRGLE